MPYLTDFALCLRVTDFSETSQIVLLFTQSHGILPVIAKGAKRQTKSSAFSGPLDLLTAGQVVFLPAKGSAELATLSAWQLTNHHAALRQNLAALHAAMFAVEITRLLLHPHDPHEDLFHELTATLALLPTPERPRALTAYVKAALTAAGYQPQLTVCLACGNPITPDQPALFSPRSGGIVCQCRGGGGVPGTLISIPAKIALALNRLPSPTTLQKTPPERPADPASLRLALNLLLAQIETTLDRPIQTRWLLDSIFPSEPRGGGA